MALDALFKLDPTGPTSNSNYAGANIAENCAPSGINNALRALGSFVAQQLCYQSAAISASVSTNIATTSTGVLMGITGAGAINSFGVVPGEQPSAAVIRFLQFSSSTSLSHGGSILLQGGVSRRTQPGDIGGYIHSGSSDVWYEFLYRSADGALAASGNSISVTTITNRSMSTSAISTVTLNAASMSVTNIAFTSLNTTSISSSVGEFTLVTIGGHGTLAQRQQATNVTYTTCGTDLPVDDSIPQIAEGDALALSLTVTPTNASSILRIQGFLHVGASTAGVVGAGLFIDSTGGALSAAGTRVEGSTDVQQLVIDHYVSASNTTQRVYHLRLGPDAGGPANAFLNGSGGGRYFGGVLRSTLTVEEMLPPL
jgi:hypothetical protein